MAAEFSVDAVKECILARGGRIRNHELVTYFKKFLNDPADKAINREKFKDFVNELATIKVEEGEKVLVLKRKHRPDNISSTSSSSGSVESSHASTTSSEQAAFQPSPAKSPYQPSSDTSYSSSAGASFLSPNPQEAESPQYRQPPPTVKEQAYTPERGPVPGDAMRAQSEPPANGDTGPREGDQMDGAMMSRGHSDESLEVRLKSSSRQKMSFDASSTSLASAESQGSLSSAAEAVSGSGEEEGGNMSVLSIKERVQHLNKMSSESDMQQSRTPAARKKTIKERDDDDESHTSGGASYITLTPEEKEWMLVSSTADYHEMFRLLNKSGRLAKVKDISNGYTALHWAAKFGKSDVVKMLANRIGVNVNQRSGYTPLHLAAIHGHEDIIELLVTVYKADANIRDYSGKKAKQYLKNSASSRAQQLLVSRRLVFAPVASSDDSFTRSVSTRQSNRARAISSLIQATSSVMRQPMLRSSWEGIISDEKVDKIPGSTPPGSCPTSPSSGRRHKDDRHLMPPPHLPSHRRRRVDRSTSSSRESLHSQSRSSSSIDKENDNPVVPRSESDPTLARKTFI